MGGVYCSGFVHGCDDGERALDGVWGGVCISRRRTAFRETVPEKRREACTSSFFGHTYELVNTVAVAVYTRLYTKCHIGCLDHFHYPIKIKTKAK